MKNTGILLALSFLMVACGTKKYDATSFIEMKKDPCFGYCPVYVFKIDGTGHATFSGERNVEKEGNWTRTLSPEETQVLFQTFENANFWDFEEEYTDSVTDLPTTWITFSHLGQTKTIKDYYGAPEALKTLEKLVEDIAETSDGWEQSSPEQ
jgi:uncharacterized protein DUF6438